MVPVRANSADLYGPSHSLLPFKSVYAAESTPEDHDASVHVRVELRTVLPVGMIRTVTLPCQWPSKLPKLPA
jgi:hypothetical protein